MSQNAKIGIGICLALIVASCCCAVALTGVGGFFVYRVAQSTEFAPIFTEAARVTPDDFFATSTPTPKPNIVLTPVPTPLPGASDTLTTLRNANIPPRDLREVAMRLKGIPDIPATVSAQSADHPVGAELEFNVHNTDTNAAFTITARLVYKTENVYFFAENGVQVDTGDVQRLVDEFQNETYPTNREFFGSEWNPGVDGDPHLYILYARGLGFSVAGYYSSNDEYSRLANRYSNEKEMFYLNADNTSPGDSDVASVLAHEFQHMIHWSHDLNEETWMNEGSSVLAELLNDYDPGGFDYSFLDEPDLQLNAWGESGGGDNAPHYGAAFLFMAYFLDRFGEEATQALVADTANGFRAVDDVLTERGVTDPVTSQPLTGVDVFADWVIANYLGDPGAADGRYAYYRYRNAPAVFDPTDTYTQCPIAAQSATVHQFAADYYRIECDGQVTLTFSGSQQAQVVPAMPHGGRYAFWGHRNDESVTSLTREFDFSGLSAVTLNYWAWWAIEDDYDYAYLEVSTDGGQTFTTIQTQYTTDYDPNGSNFGWGYTANSGGEDEPRWVEETVDLSEYAGQTVLVRFEYITDPAVNRPGFLLDDIRISELNYAADFESDDGGWEAQGFVRMDNLLPQTFIVQVIRQGATTTIERMALDARNQGTLSLNIANGETAVLVVSGTAPFTTEVASYEFAVER